MNNPFNGMIGGGLPGPIGKMQTMMQSFQQFAGAFKGDPKQTVQGLLNSGKMTQEQYNQLQNMARQFQQMMGERGNG